MTHEEIREQLGAYALYALAPEERAEVDTHLESCVHCRAEAEELIQVQEQLGLLTEERDPPPALRTRLLSIVAEERRQWLETQAQTPQASEASTQGRPSTSRSTGGRTTASGAVLSPWERLSGWLRATPRLAIGAASAAVVAVIAIGIILSQRNTVNVVRTYACAVAQPRAAGNSFTATGCAIHIRSNNTVQVAFTSLPRLSAQQAYELWALPAKGNPVPIAGITGATGGAFNKTYALDPSRYPKAAISIEQAPGNSAVPHGPIVFVLPLRG